tara:strand:+ start:712 stop:1233 length:522 start_codon:yes stop_codon:yes gene_type:complete
MKNKFILFITIILLCFCFIVLYNSLDNSNTYTPKLDNLKDVPVFKAKDFNSNLYIESKKVFEKDNFYIVNIWASWCVPCRDEHPLLMELSKYKSIKIIGLNYRDNPDNAKKFINKFGNPYYQNIIDNEGILAVEFGAYGVPETFLINKDKKITKKFVGPINKKIVEEIKLIIK